MITDDFNEASGKMNDIEEAYRFLTRIRNNNRKHTVNFCSSKPNNFKNV